MEFICYPKCSTCKKAKKNEVIDVESKDVASDEETCEEK